MCVNCREEPDTPPPPLERGRVLKPVPLKPQPDDALRAPESDQNPVPGVPTLGTGERQPRASRAGEKPYACGGCDTRWSGGGRGHCSGCHRMFNTTALFDRHRRLRGEHGYCVDPATINTPDGPLRLLNDVWCGPEIPADALARRRASRLVSDLRGVRGL